MSEVSDNQSERAGESLHRDVSMLSADFDTLFEMARERTDVSEEDSETTDMQHPAADKRRSSSAKSSCKREYLRKQKVLHGHHSATSSRDCHHSVTSSRDDHHSATSSRDGHHSATSSRDGYTDNSEMGSGEVSSSTHLHPRHSSHHHYHGNSDGNGHHASANTSRHHSRTKASARSKSLREGRNQYEYRSRGGGSNDQLSLQEQTLRDVWDDEEDTWQMRPRLYSQPVKKTVSTETSDSSYCGFRRVRSFRITRKGLEKEDLVVKSSKESLKNSVLQKTNKTAVCKRHTDTDKHRTYTVSLIGSKGVGKRAMIHDFMMPDDFLEQMGFTENHEDGEKSVSILLDGEESTLEFVDLSLRQSDTEVGREDSGDQVDAYVVVYSVEDRKSFETAIDRLFDIREKYGKEVAVILVANKTDLVRTRVIHEEEGKSAAKTYDCKYIEVSAAIDHKIDELLVGILKQIRLMKDRRQQRQQSVDGKDSCCPIRAKQSVLGKLFGKSKRQTKSCENLYVL